MDHNLRGTPLFSRLDDQAAVSLERSMVPQALKKGKHLFQEGEPGDRLYIVMRGKIKLTHASGDGRESLLMVLGPGDMFGELSLFDPGPRTSTAVAVTDSEVLGLGNNDLRPWLTGHPEVGQSLLQALAHRLRRTNEIMSDLVFADVPGRVAKALIELGEKFGSRTEGGLLVHHDLTQEELAQLVGASRETVNKALADFASRGWIRLETRSVEIFDQERLAKRAK
ncbi:MAG: Crp/Fnr family transcriptional regulator [Actinomycetes bacterium]